MRHPEAVSRYADARPGVLPPSLAALRGPTSGTVELPRHIDWGPEYGYDLADDADLRVMYERVIREAQDASELAMLLDGRTLVRLWPHLVIPTAVRVRWESRFGELRHPAA